MSGHAPIRVVARISGRVQRVGYRAAAQREARRLGLTGWARNEPDGSVTVEAEGDPGAVDLFLAWCATGPRGAVVASVERTPIALAGDRDFTIRPSRRA